MLAPEWNNRRLELSLLHAKLVQREGLSETRLFGPNLISNEMQRSVQSHGVFSRLLVALVTLGWSALPARAADDPAALQISRLTSLNYNDRPADAIIDTVVLHATTTQTWQEAVRFFLKPSDGVSAHYTVARNGRVFAHVPEEKRAWHAGVSRMPDGRENVNDFSIGIELVNLNDGEDPYGPEQIEALRALLLGIYRRHPILHLTSHAAVAFPPGRSSDPKGLDLALLPQPFHTPVRAVAAGQGLRPLAVVLAIGAGVLLLIFVEACRRLFLQPAARNA